MSRSSYTDDYGDDHPGQINLFRGNVRRSIRGKRGRARLRELRDALVSLPVKELHAEIFAEGSSAAPQVCALGAWALAKQGGDPDQARALLKDGRDAMDEETAADLETHGWPRLVVMEAIYFNDEGRPWVYDTVEGPQQDPWMAGRPVRYGRPETPAERYTRMLEWVEQMLLGDVD